MPWTTQAAEPPPRRERLFNAPLAAVLLAASMPALFALQLNLPDEGVRWAFYPADLGQGRFGGLFTSMLLHSGWMHALMNAAAALIFGTPVARLMGEGRGTAAFFAFYIGCGVLAALGYALVHPFGTDPVVGASGAVFGLIGAATRLLGGRGRVLPLTDRRVIGAAVAWMAVNAVTGLIGFAPGVEGARIAWEAHAAGFLAGILAIGPVSRLFKRS